MLENALKSAELNGLPIVARSYDGAAVMAGKDDGVRKKFTARTQMPLCSLHGTQIEFGNRSFVNICLWRQ